MPEGDRGDDGGDGEAGPKLTVFGSTIRTESAYGRDAPRVDINVDRGEVFVHAPLAIVDADLFFSLSLAGAVARFQHEDEAHLGHRATRFGRCVIHCGARV